MKLCNYRSDRNKRSNCWLRLDYLHEEGFDGRDIRMRDSEGHRTYERTVFTYDGRGETPLKEVYARHHELALCDELMSQVCPFRVHTPRGPYKRVMEPLEACPYCGNRHYGNSEARKYCENWHKAEEIFKEMFDSNEKWSVRGSREDPFKGKLTPYYQQALWSHIRYAVMERDNWTCQICGISSEKVGYAPRHDSFPISYSIGHMVWDSMTDSSLATHFELYKKDDYGYRVANDYIGLQVHHIIFRENGGSDHPRNLMTLCEYCHHWWHSKHGGGSRNMAKKAQRNKHLDEFKDEE